MGLYKTLSQDVEEVDVIIAGGGTAACIVAGRLAEADPNLSILVIERGPDNYGNPDIVSPGMFLSNLMPGSKTAIVYEGEMSEELGGRPVPVHSGGTLGGGSSINIMVYSRGQRDDFDSWETPGWSTDELMPFIKKLETYHGIGPRDESRHGYEGPTQVSSGTLRIKRVEDAFLQAAAKVGYPEKPDMHVFDHNNGFARYMRYIGKDGKRSDAAHVYLHPRLRDGKHPNLHVVVESRVIRVLFDKDKRASGVEYKPNDKDAPKRTIRARKLVVVSSGACGTPSILERSGIGRADILKKAGVPLVEDLPGVGHDYQDHHTAIVPFSTSLEPHETLDEFVQGRLTLEEAIKNNDPRLGWNAVDVGGKCRPTDDEVLALGPEFKEMWDKDFKNKPNRPLVFISIFNGALGPPGYVAPGQYMTLSYHTAYPRSRGHLHITGPGLDDPLDFRTGFFSGAGAVDIKAQVWAYKIGREIVRRVPFYRGEPQARHPDFPAGSKASCVTLDADQKDVSAVKDLVYTSEDDKVIDQFIRKTVQTTWHSLGTAKMAPRNKMGVVDKDLNVYGVKGLKVIDLSIPPENVAANTNNTTFIIGEKGADIILRELGIRR
ncbi:GMC oxidoreductase [Xylaria intraflava]|nr:GMC oxidoreductase [Xylaria intraflava]